MACVKTSLLHGFQVTLETCFILSLWFASVQTLGQCGRKEKVQMTVVSFKPQNSESASAPLPHYECYLGEEDDDADVTSSRLHGTRNGEEAPPYSAVLVKGDNLPNNTAVYNVSLDITSDNAFGVFTCVASKDERQNTSIVTIFLRSDGYLSPSDQLSTKTVSVGDTGVTINMTVVRAGEIPRGEKGLDIRWRINGSNTISKNSAGAYLGQNYLLLQSRPIRGSDDGVYESHGFLLRDARHALQRLIVRSCMKGMWGPPGCNGICDNCYNGGVCDDETGRCICPPGFRGRNCLESCGPNKFGYSCEFKCDNGDAGDCEGRQFCLADPYGCTCTTGYKTLSCTTRCEDGKFGASCLQDCHCGSSLCDRFTGECVSGNCESGWSGTNCQIPDVCPTGYYGNHCTEKCLCADNVSCDKMTGECSNRECAPGSHNGGGTACQECPVGFFGNACLEECHCESDACDKATGDCVGCCKPQWVETQNHTCQVGLQASEFLKVNEGSTATISCTAIGPNVNDFWIKLSRDSIKLEVTGITQSSPDDSENILRTTFSIRNVHSRDNFFCQLWGMDALGQRVRSAWLNTSFSAYELPLLSDAPVLQRRTNISVTIEWRAWGPDIDIGDPPVISYFVYYRTVEANEWVKGSTVLFNEVREFTASDLNVDTVYVFTVSVTREGDGGEGGMSPPLIVKTLCSANIPVNVKASLVEPKQVNVSWQISSDDSLCTSRISSFIVYYNTDDNSQEPKAIGATQSGRNWLIVSNGLLPDLDYTFFVVSVAGGYLSPFSDPSPVISLFPFNHETTSQGTSLTASKSGNSQKEFSGVTWIILLVSIIVVTYSVLLMWFALKKLKRARTTEGAGEAVSPRDHKPSDKVDLQKQASTGGPKPQTINEEEQLYELPTTENGLNYETAA